MLHVYLVVLILLLIGIIGSQIPHVYYVMRQFSLLKKYDRIQAGMFSGIVSVLILYFAFSGQHLFALIGAIVEVVFNSIYYGEKSKQITVPPHTVNAARKKGNEKWVKFWYKFWAKRKENFITLLIPSGIYIISLELTKVIDRLGINIPQF